jgi:hypothetical protein
MLATIILLSKNIYILNIIGINVYFVLYQTLSLHLKKEHVVKVIENRMLRILASEREIVTGR